MISGRARAEQLPVSASQAERVMVRYGATSMVLTRTQRDEPFGPRRSNDASFGYRMRRATFGLLMGGKDHLGGATQRGVSLQAEGGEPGGLEFSDNTIKLVANQAGTVSRFYLRTKDYITSVSRRPE